MSNLDAMADIIASAILVRNGNDENINEIHDRVKKQLLEEEFKDFLIKRLGDRENGY